MNKVLLIGNLTRDPDVTLTQSGTKRAAFTVAVTRSYTNQNGEREADYIQCTAYKETAALVEKYLVRGRKVAVEASIRTGKYEKDGHTVYTKDVVVQHIEFLSSRSNQSENLQAAAPQQAEEPSNPTDQFVEVEDDELPF